MHKTDLQMVVIDSDCDLGIIRRGQQELFPAEDDVDYAFFERNRTKLMNVISVTDFSKLLEDESTIHVL
ncbi:hypothetical protein DIU31_021665 [Mucilaginibacter rubeus]|uniref:Uncharacterized protein n=1 Tax=Mucilaginibacter rubeus TaxID=2027860 RepID=A0AAE6MK26_9SPHI|nr:MULTISPECIES: hypothetical protein [Mucilaginibacter]QEM05989.1 hypothetical protein DIU31_021665 [Mucilaginibacter rubeus]QEM18570.1 hypothetical protein DIU38_021890 [Mucilaginibacter gossypii]QTE44889.1 hypothetical protein J3L19_05835 [Mucilaginibacter rubeus]QTE51487.1 hypothetical protein J3L21_05810 [Mucilaginibacter rubeus]QTE56573.1 hypothetical protein J3L23_31055 [Mucilaginibacter rubeus]